MSGLNLGKYRENRGRMWLHRLLTLALLADNICHNLLYDSSLGKPQNTIDYQVEVCKIMLFDQLDVVVRRASSTISSGLAQ